MSWPPKRVVEDLGLEPPALALLAGGGDRGHQPQVGVDDAGAVAGRAGALGVGAEQGRLDAVGLRERLADRVQQPGVGGRVAAPRASDRGLVHRHHAVPTRDRAVDQRALSRPGHPGDHDQHSERDVDVDVAQVVRVGAAHLQCPRRRPHRRLQRGPVVQVPPGQRSAGPQALDRALEHHLAAGRTGARAEVDDVVGDRDRLRLVLDHQHGVALVPQLQQQRVHPLDVVRVQPDRRLVEDVGDLGERRPEMPDHLGALRLAAGQRAGRAVQAEVAQPDLHERLQALPQGGQQRPDARLVQPPDPGTQVADLQGADVGDAEPVDLGRPGRLAEPGSATVGTAGERDRPLHEGADVRLHGVDVLGQVRLLDRGDETRVGQVDPLHLDLGRLLVQQVVELPLGVPADRLVGVEEAAAAVDPAVPAVHAVAGHGDRALVEGQTGVVQGAEVEVGHRPHALAARAHAAGDGETAPLLDRPAAAFERDGARSADRGDVEGVRLRRSDVRLSQAAEEDPQQRVGVGGGAERGAGVGPHPLLVDDDRGGQPVEDVDVRSGQVGHEALHEGAVGLVDHPLRLRGDGAEHQRALARAGDAGERGQPALRDLDVDVLEVVHPRPVHPDQVVPVGSVPRRGLPVRRCGGPGVLLGGAHRSWSSPRTLPSGSVTVATSRPPPTSCAGSCTVAPAAVTSASLASRSGTCQ